MADTITQDDFRKLFVTVKPDKKRLLNDWCVKTHGEPLGAWFANTATDQEKVAFVDEIKKSVKSEDWGYFSGESTVEEGAAPEKPKCKHGVPLDKDCTHCQEDPDEPDGSSEPSAEPEPEPEPAPISQNSEDIEPPELDEDKVRDWLKEHGYKTDLVRDERSVTAKVDVYVAVPAHVDDVESYVTEELNQHLTGGFGFEVKGYTTNES